MTINIVVVSESILIDQSTEREPDVIQFKRWKTSVSLNPKYSKKIIQEKIAAITNHCDILIQFGGKGMFESALAGKPLITYDFDMTGLFGLIA